MWIEESRQKSDKMKLYPVDYSFKKLSCKIRDIYGKNRDEK